MGLKFRTRGGGEERVLLIDGNKWRSFKSTHPVSHGSCLEIRV